MHVGKAIPSRKQQNRAADVVGAATIGVRDGLNTTRNDI